MKELLFCWVRRSYFSINVTLTRILFSSVRSSSVYHGLLHTSGHFSKFFKFGAILPIYIHNSLSLSFSVQHTEQNQVILLHACMYKFLKVSTRFFRFLWDPTCAIFSKCVGFNPPWYPVTPQVQFKFPRVINPTPHTQWKLSAPISDRTQHQKMSYEPPSATYFSLIKKNDCSAPLTIGHFMLQIVGLPWKFFGERIF